MFIGLGYREIHYILKSKFVFEVFFVYYVVEAQAHIIQGQNWQLSLHYICWRKLRNIIRKPMSRDLIGAIDIDLIYTSDFSPRLIPAPANLTPVIPALDDKDQQVPVVCVGRGGYEYTSLRCNM